MSIREAAATLDSMLTSVIASVASALALLSPLAAPASQPADPSLNSKNYSITETIRNSSSQTLTIASVSVDNNATLDPHAQSVAPGGELGLYAHNHGNGITLALKLVSDNGSEVHVTFDVPKVNPNSIDGSTSGTVEFTDYRYTRGDNPKTSVTVVDSSSCDSRFFCFDKFSG